MRRRRWFGGVAAAAWLLAGQTALAASAAPALLPAPGAITATDGALALTGRFTVQVEGCKGPLVPGALVRFQHDLDRLAGASLAAASPTLHVSCLAHDAAPLTLGAREGYRLTVSAGRASLWARSWSA